MQLAFGALGAGAVAFAAWRSRALTADGAVAAGVVGFVVFGWGGPAASVPLLLFFASGTWLTRWSARRRPPGTPPSTRGARHVDPKAARKASSGPDRGGTADARGRRASQVAANGAVAAAAVVAAALWPHPVWLAAYGGALAASAADTWATELGVLSRRPPVLVTTRRPAPPGRSGAVSAPGTWAGLGGAGFIALAWTLSTLAGEPFGVATPSGPSLTAAVATGGFLGMLSDSVLGATVQARFRCPACGAETEHARHFCRAGGVKTERIHGCAGFNNDTVNFAATLIGAGAAAVLYRLLTSAA